MTSRITHIDISTGKDATVSYRALHRYQGGGRQGELLALVFGKDADEAEERGAVLGSAYDMLQLLEELSETQVSVSDDALDLIHKLLKQIKEG